jgi:dodecin
VSDHIYKILELTGSSTENMEAAIRAAVDKAAQTVRQMRWFEVTDMRGSIKDGHIHNWQVTIKIGFTLED